MIDNFTANGYYKEGGLCLRLAAEHGDITFEILMSLSMLPMPPCTYVCLIQYFYTLLISFRLHYRMLLTPT
jgi:hypothetical protein